MNPDTTWGLRPADIKALQNQFSKFPAIDTVIIYGSRAKGNYKPGSDIDLTLLGDEVSFQELAQLSDLIDDLLLPYQVDLSLYREITNDDLLDHINRVGVTFYTGKKRVPSE